MIKKPKKIISSLIVMVILALALTTGTYAVDNNTDNDKTVYMIIINRLTINDIEMMDNVNWLIDNGAIGLMNTRGTYGYTGPESYITINTSTRAYADFSTSQFFNLDGPKAKVYERRTGSITDNSKIGNIEFNRLININRNKNFSPYLGALGENLHNSGQRTAVFGNSDTADSILRANSLIAMDSRGLINYGNIDNILLEDDTYPFGIKTDFDKIIEEINLIEGQASFVVIETGDINRLQSYSSQLNDDMYLYHRSRIINTIDSFIGDLLQNIDRENSMIMIVSPNASDDRFSRSRLSPLIIWEENSPSGLLTSGTTRREGIVSNIDIAPTITNYLGASSENFVGQRMSSMQRDDSIGYVTTLNRRTNVVAALRGSILNFYSTIVIILLILAIAIFLLKFNKTKLAIILRIGALSVMAMPLYFLLISYIEIQSMFTYISLLIGYLTVVIALLYRIDYRKVILAIMGITFIAILIDIGTGGSLIKYSVLGYDPIIGARYFGIGNEMTGVLLGTMVVAVGAFAQLYGKKPITWFMLLLTLVIVAHPLLGANLGGTMSIAITAIIFILYSSGLKVNVKRAIYIGLGLTAIVLLMVVIDIFFTSSPSHLGNIAMQILERGPMTFIETVTRKLQMNIRLIGVSVWTRVLYISIITMAFMMIFLRDTMKNLLNNNKYIFSGLFAGILGSIVGLIVNDSGILLASISNIFITVTLLYATIGYVSDKMARK